MIICDAPENSALTFSFPKFLGNFWPRPDQTFVVAVLGCCFCGQRARGGTAENAIFIIYEVHDDTR